MFGCTHICALDGYSSKIVGFITLPVKNNYTIYSDLFMYVRLALMLINMLHDIVTHTLLCTSIRVKLVNVLMYVL